MFGFIVQRLGFLKRVPFLAAGFDGLLRVWLLITNRTLLKTLDEIDEEVLSWSDVDLVNHKYGGTQFNTGKREIGHIHGNGLMDIHFTKKRKEQLMKEGRAQEHHVLRGSGWISFPIRAAADKRAAIELLRMSYEEKVKAG